jgi:thiamine biosynthesis protein ThiS
MSSAVPAPEPAAVELVVNGRAERVAAGASVADLVTALGREPRLVAVERNGEIVPRARWPAVLVAAGDRLEIVQFVQGG